MNLSWRGVLITLIVIGVGAVGSGRTPYYLKREQISINGNDFKVERAVTDRQRRSGLMYRSNLPTNRGMALIYNSEGIRSIWMRNMRFPIDAVWLAADGTVVDLAQNLRPELDAHTGVLPAQYVIELPAGTIQLLAIKAGSYIAVLVYN